MLRRPSRTYRIGRLATESGLTPDALRYYERRGLLPPASRSAGGFREYDSSALDRLRFIKHAKSHGLTLKDIRDLIGYQATAGRVRCRRVHDLLCQKLTELEIRRAELDEFCRTLRHYREMCARALASSSNTDCPVVEDLGKPRSRIGKAK